MIQTQMGNEIEILAYRSSSQEVVARRFSDNAERVYSLNQLKADGGIAEILEEIAALPEDCRS